MNKSVNCPNCGGVISIFDEKCPYCDSVNHMREERKVTETERRAGLNVPLIVVIILLVANIAAAVFAGSAYSMGLARQRAVNEANADEIYSKFRGYLEAGDYLLAENYLDSDSYYSVSTLKPYRSVTNALSEYSAIFFNVAPQRESGYNKDALLECVGSVARQIEAMYSKDTYMSVPQADDANEYTARITYEAQALVARAYGLTDEETKRLPYMKSGQIEQMLRNAYLRNASVGNADESEVME